MALFSNDFLEKVYMVAIEIPSTKEGADSVSTSYFRNECADFSIEKYGREIYPAITTTVLSG